MSLVSLLTACLSVRLPSHDTDTAREEEDDEEEDQRLGWKEQDSLSMREHTQSETRMTSTMICMLLEDYKLQPTSQFIIVVIHSFICERQIRRLASEL